MGVVGGVTIGLGMLAAWSGAPRRARIAAEKPVPHARGDALRLGGAALREIPAFRRLLGAFVLQALATGAMLAGAQYVATYTLGSEGAVTYLFVALVAPALLVMPLGTRLARRFGKKRSFVGASILFAAAALALVPMRWVPGGWVYACVALAGVAYAGMQLYPLAMLPDVVAVDARERGEDRAGVLGGVWTAGETAGLALGPTLVLGMLAVTGFVSTTGDETVAQPTSALNGISLAFSLLPAVLALASLVPLLRYPLSADVVDLTDPLEVHP